MSILVLEMEGNSFHVSFDGASTCVGLVEISTIFVMHDDFFSLDNACESIVLFSLSDMRPGL